MALFTPSLGFTLRASLWLFKIVPDDFVIPTAQRMML
jgi:hypothetical protein